MDKDAEEKAAKDKKEAKEKAAADRIIADKKKAKEKADAKIAAAEKKVADEKKAKETGIFVFEIDGQVSIRTNVTIINNAVSKKPFRTQV